MSSGGGFSGPWPQSSGKRFLRVDHVVDDELSPELLESINLMLAGRVSEIGQRVVPTRPIHMPGVEHS